MSDAPEEQTQPTPKRAGALRRLWLAVRLLVGLVVSLAVTSALAIYAALWLGGQVMVLPDGATAEVTGRLNALMSHGEIRVGEIGVAVGEDHAPKLVAFNLDLRDSSGGAAGAVRRVSLDLSLRALLRGRPGVAGISFDGAQMTIRRAADGSFSVDFGGGSGEQITSLTAVLDQLDQSLNRGAMVEIEEVRVNGLTVILEDARSARVWQAANARAVVRKSDGALSMTLASDVFNGTDTLGEVQFSATFDRGTRATALSVRFADVAAADVALQSPVLSWLAVLDAPLSGAVRATFGGAGALESLAGTLDIAAGVLQPTPASTALPFQNAAVYFDMDPATQRIRFSELRVDSDALTVSASGVADLTEFSGPWPGAYVGQLQFQQLTYSDEAVFDVPLELDRGQADFRLRLDPFTVEVGQLWAEADAGTVRVDAKAQVAATAEGWQVSLDAEAPTLSAAVLSASWPRPLAPRTRQFLVRRLSAGMLYDLDAAVRFVSGSKPDIGLSFRFEDGALEFLDDLPPITGASGVANIARHRMTLRVAEGQVVAPDGRALQAGGTVFAIPDTRPKPATAHLSLVGAGPLETALTLLDRRPFRIMSRVGRTPDLAEGLVSIRADVTFPLRKGIQNKDVDYRVTARVFDVGSDKLAPGRRVTADALDLVVTPERLRIEGPVRLDGVPLTALWEQPLGQGTRPAPLTGQVRLTPQRLAQVGVTLPPGLVEGETAANWTLSFPQDAPPRLAVTSDLSGATLNLSAVGWRKERRARGGLDLVVDLGETPAVRQLALSAPGLAAEGRVDLAAGGGVRAVAFDRVRLGGFLDAPVRITPNGSVTEIEISGGRFDLTQLGRGQGGGGDGAARITFNLDEAVITEGLSLRPVRGSLTTSGGVSGQFEGALNGAGPVTGELVPFRGRTAVQLVSPDAGETIRAAGFMKNLHGGDLTLNLLPRAETAYDGEFQIRGIAMRQAPVMAELLDAISIVGLFDQLDGPGLRFETVEGAFGLTEDQLVLRQMAATGPSLGLSLDGTYGLQSKTLDMQGVISPVYFLNAIGQIFTRRGEGLFGFTFRLTGGAEGPNVSVNPLSILTPGMFREIFRRAPPDG